MRKFIIWLMKIASDERQKYSIGQKAPISGFYWDKATNDLIPLSKGERFPPSQGYGVNWFLLFSLE